MGRRQSRAELTSRIEDVQRRLSLTYVLVEELAESLVGRRTTERTDDLFRRARSHLEPIASEVEAMAKTFWLGQGYLKAPSDVALRGTLVSVFMGAQVVALYMTIDAMALVGAAHGTEEAFLRETIRACTFAYATHASMIDAALGADLESLRAMRQVYGSDPGGASADFSRRVDDFELVKDRMLARV